MSTREVIFAVAWTVLVLAAIVLAQLENGRLALGIGISSLASASSFFMALALIRRSRLYEDTPTSRISSAPQGFVELEGWAELMPGQPIVAPLTGSRCCWWRCRIEQLPAEDQMGLKSWMLVQEMTSDSLFHFRDSSGTCVVNPDGASVIPSVRVVWYGSLSLPVHGPRKKRTLGEVLFESNYRYIEERIVVGSPLYALGQLRTHRGAMAQEHPRDAVRDLLVKWKHDKRMMALFDRNADGKVDMVEWDAAQNLARERVQEKVMQEMPGVDVPVLAKPDHGRPYILSARTQRRLIEANRWRAAALLVLSVLAGAAAGYLGRSAGGS